MTTASLFPFLCLGALGVLTQLAAMMALLRLGRGVGSKAALWILAVGGIVLGDVLLFCVTKLWPEQFTRFF